MDDSFWVAFSRGGANRPSSLVVGSSFSTRMDGILEGDARLMNARR